MLIALVSIIFLTILFLLLAFVFFGRIWDKTIGKNRCDYLSAEQKKARRAAQLVYGTLSLLLALGFLMALISWYAYVANLVNLAYISDFASRLLLMGAVLGVMLYLISARTRFYKQ